MAITPDTVVFNDVTILDLFVVLIIILIIFTVTKVITLNFTRAFKGKLSKDRLRTMVKLFNWGAAIFALIVILPIIKIDSNGILVAGGIIALIIGLATQSVIANLVAGIFLMLERPVKIGDSIEVDDDRGVVEDIRIMSTRVRTFDGLYIRIPNETVFTSNITNYSVNIVRRFELVFGIGYEDEVNKSLGIIKKQIEEAPFALVNPAPDIFVEQLAESTVNIKARVWAPQSEWFDVKTELIWKIKEALEADGISLPAPQREVSFKNKPVLA